MRQIDYVSESQPKRRVVRAHVLTWLIRVSLWVVFAVIATNVEASWWTLALPGIAVMLLAELAMYRYILRPVLNPTA
ncbi:hypothetical protein IEU95_01240 [Hoyosella rhizosphaerae]|nr:hypothetical protein [Hoyosella rhizosphaerae]MBN4925442.1 hypothetical protein [Hoyosella rhizosphaerae]